MRERVAGMDVLRLMAMVAVVAIHTSTPLLHLATPGSVPYLALLAMNQASRFAVPVFVFLSGLGLALASGGTFRRRAARLVPDYLIWSVVYIGVGNLLRGREVTQLTVAVDLFTGSAWYHLYFVPMILLLYAAFPWLAPLFRRWPGVVLAGVVTLVAQGLRFEVPLPAWLFVLVKSFSPIVWLFYFALGIWSAAHLDRVRDWCERYAAVLVAAAASFVGVLVLEVVRKTGAGMPIDAAITQVRPLVAPYSLLVLAAGFGVRWPERLARLAAWMHRPSFGVYLAHPFLIALWLPGRNAPESALPWIAAGWTVVVLVGALAISLVMQPLLERAQTSLAGRR